MKMFCFYIGRAVVWPHLFETVLEKIYAFRHTNFSYSVLLHWLLWLLVSLKRRPRRPLRHLPLLLRLLLPVSQHPKCKRGTDMQKEDIGGDFTLTDGDGKPFSLSDLKGQSGSSCRLYPLS